MCPLVPLPALKGGMKKAINCLVAFGEAPGLHYMIKTPKLETLKTMHTKLEGIHFPPMVVSLLRVEICCFFAFKKVKHQK